MAFKPAYNIGFVAYYKLNINTIVKKYCINKNAPKLKCNGKCYLKKRLNLTQATTSNSNEEAILKSFSEVFFPVYFEYKDTNYTIFNKRITPKINSFITLSHKELAIAIQTPPPQV